MNSDCLSITSLDHQVQRGVDTSLLSHIMDSYGTNSPELNQKVSALIVVHKIGKRYLSQCNP